MQRTAVQNKIVDLANAGKFYAINYDSETGHASADTDKVIAPASAVANEVFSTARPAERHRRSDRLERAEWAFVLHLGFHLEVTVEQFEADLWKTPSILPADATAGHRQITLQLLRCEYTHPKQHGSGGTDAVLTFKANLSKS